MVYPSVSIGVDLAQQAIVLVEGSEYKWVDVYIMYVYTLLVSLIISTYIYTFVFCRILVTYTDFIPNSYLHHIDTKSTQQHVT